MALRDAFQSTLPPWLAERVSVAIQWAIALVLDAEWDATREGIKARMPGVGTPTALGYIGDDRLIDRGPTEGDESYGARLGGAFDTWRGAGNPYRLLEQVRAYFLPSPPAIRAVSDASVWHEIDPTTAEVTRTIPPVANWVWDAHSPPFAGGTPRWWRGWVVIDAVGRWSKWQIGSGRKIGDPGLTIGSTATHNEIVSLRRIVRRFRPQHVTAMNIILAFDHALFLASSAPGAPMPSGDYDNEMIRASSACYLKGEG